jgi:endoglucanase
MAAMRHPRGRRGSARLGPMAALLLSVLMVALQASAQTPPAPSAFEVAKQLGRGLNVLGYDPLWDDRSRARFQTRHFRIIHEAGFQTLRVNLQAFAHMDGANQLDPKWLETLDWVVREAQSQHLNVIIDEHDFEFCARDIDACRPKLMAFWTQIAARYKDQPSSMLFEILNEPNGQLTPAPWNRLSADVLALIRQTNPTRTVVIGPAFWNNIGYLDQLTLPADDPHILVTVHYYLPMTFTHQGASWSASTKDLSGVTWGKPEEYARLSADFDKVQAWATAHDRPILLGEFGAYEKGDMASRVAYTSAVARAAEAHGWPWAYWQFDSNFIAYDMARDAWVEPIRKALAP